MKELKINEMKNISAGGVTASLINAVTSSLSFVADLGRYFGSSIRRFFSNNIC